MVHLGLTIAEVKDGTREELIKALACLGEQVDADFSGDNGWDYLWDRVWEENGFNNYEDWQMNGEPVLKYESNLDYLCNMVKDVKDDVECIETFLQDWLYYDSYYKDYQYDLLMDSNGITAIVLAYTYGD